MLVVLTLALTTLGLISYLYNKSEQQNAETRVVDYSIMETMDIEEILTCDSYLVIIAPRQEKIYDELQEIAPTVMLED